MKKYTAHIGVVVCLLWGLVHANLALAMSSPPPEPSPDTTISQISPVPGTPDLSADLIKTQLKLSWNATDHAEYYPLYIQNGRQWRHLENIYETTVAYDYQQMEWNPNYLQLKILACKTPPLWLFWRPDTCSSYSNIIRLQDYLAILNTDFTLSSYPTTLATHSSSIVNLNMNADAERARASVSSDELVGVGTVRTVLATLRLRDAVSYEFQDALWPIYLDTTNFTVTSSKTMTVSPGNYNIELLATDGDIQYVARALNVRLDETQQAISMQLKTLLGNAQIDIDEVITLPEFQFQLSPDELGTITQPKIGVKINSGNETLLTFNPNTHIVPQYLAVSSGQHQIKLNLYDGALLSGHSRPQQESPVIVNGQSLIMDLVPLHGEIVLSMDSATSEASLSIAVPAEVVEEVGGNASNLQTIVSLSDANNQPSDVTLTGLVYNSATDAYEAQHTYSGMQAGSQVFLGLIFIDKGTEPDELIGHCVAEGLVLDSSVRNMPCNMTLRRRAIVASHHPSRLDVNVRNANHTAVRGVALYARRQSSQDTNDNSEDLGLFVGLTSDGNHGVNGRLQTYLTAGSYQLTAIHPPSDTRAQAVITLSASSNANVDLTLQSTSSQDDSESEDTTDDNNPPPVTDVANYQEGHPYIGGDRVVNYGVVYVCNEGVTSPWCSGAAWAYEPGVGTAWREAWRVLGETDPPSPNDDGDNGDSDDNGDSGNDGSDDNGPSPNRDTVLLSDLQQREYELTNSELMVKVKNSIRTRPNELIESIQPGAMSNPANVVRVENIISSSEWDYLFSKRAPEYTYLNFLKAVGKFPAFCADYNDSRDSEAICRKALATMFAHFGQETGGHTSHWDVPEWRQGLHWVREMGWTETMRGGYNGECNPDVWQGQTWPCGTFDDTGEFKSYFGRGAKQLSYNYNYGPFSLAMFGTVRTLLDNPELVADTWLNLASAVFFFVYPQPPKPSMLFVIDGTWQPNSADLANNLTSGFGVTTQIINGGVECGGSVEIAQSLNRISYYQSFAQHLGVAIGVDEQLGCAGMKQFDNAGSGALPIYWEKDWSWTEDTHSGDSLACQLVNYQTPFTAFTSGDYVRCVDHHFDVDILPLSQ